MMRIKKGKARCSIDMCVCHHLVDIGLRDSLLGIVNARGDALPFCVNHVDDGACTADENVWLGLK